MTKSFWIALQFLTYLPTPKQNKPYTDKELGFSVLTYPLVGLIIGLLLFAISKGPVENRSTFY